MEKDLPQYKKFFADTELKTEERISVTEKKVEKKVSEALESIGENYKENITEVE